MLKTLMKSIREYKKPSILTSLFVTLEVVLEVLVPYFMADLINFGIYGGNMNLVLMYGLILLFFTVLSLLFGFLSGSFCATASSGFAKNLRKDMFDKIQNFSFYNIDKFSTSSLVTRLTTDISYVQMSYQMIIRIAIKSPLTILFTLVMTFTINANMALIYLIIAPLLFLALLFLITKVHPIFIKVIKKYDDLNTVVQENVRAIRVVKSYVREDFEIKKFNKTSEEIYKEFSHARSIIALNAPLMQLAIFASILLISWFGANIIVSTNSVALNAGQLTTLFAYSMQILMSLMMLTMVLITIAISRASAQRIVEILNEIPNISNPKNPATKVKNGSIKFDNVAFSYSNDISKLCLKNVDIEIKSGETIGIIGGTGSSKTSLISLIPRLYDTTSGTVFVGNKDVKEYDLDALRNQVAVVLQKNVLFSGTIKENLMWGNENATDNQIKKACKLAHADEFIETFKDKYETHLEQGGTNLSGGQKQRLCIARALLKNPKILILDDSTSAVDTKTDAEIRKSFKEEIPKITKLIIAQRIASVEDADKILVLESGQIVAFGSHNELLKTCDIYKEIYKSQTKGGKK